MLLHVHGPLVVLFKDPIGNKPAHVAGFYGLSWPCNFWCCGVLAVPVWDGIVMRYLLNVYIILYLCDLLFIML